MSKSLTIEYEQYPPIDGTTADVSFDGEAVGTMIYSEDLEQWNDAGNPGEISDEVPEECALKMIEYYTEE